MQPATFGGKWASTALLIQAGHCPQLLAFLSMACRLHVAHDAISGDPQKSLLKLT